MPARPIEIKCPSCSVASRTWRATLVGIGNPARDFSVTSPLEIPEEELRRGLRGRPAVKCLSCGYAMEKHEMEVRVEHRLEELRQHVTTGLANAEPSDGPETESNFSSESNSLLANEHNSMSGMRREAGLTECSGCGEHYAMTRLDASAPCPECGTQNENPNR